MSRSARAFKNPLASKTNALLGVLFLLFFSDKIKHGITCELSALCTLEVEQCITRDTCLNVHCVSFFHCVTAKSREFTCNFKVYFF